MRKPLSPLKAVAKKYQQKATYSATSGLYTLMWGEKPKRSRKKKSWFGIIVLFCNLKLKIDLLFGLVIWNWKLICCFKPYFEIENWFRLRFDHAKEKTQIKKNFFPKYAPTL